MTQAMTSAFVQRKKKYEENRQALELAVKDKMIGNS